MSWAKGRCSTAEPPGRPLTPKGSGGGPSAGRCPKSLLSPSSWPPPPPPPRERREGLLSPPAGVNVSANQDEELHHETFLMQIDGDTGKCTFYSSTGGYWTLVAHGGIQATATQV